MLEIIDAKISSNIVELILLLILKENNYIIDLISKKNYIKYGLIVFIGFAKFYTSIISINSS